jgi:hypothetical protein
MFQSVENEIDEASQLIVFAKKQDGKSSGNRCSTQPTACKNATKIFILTNAQRV